MFKDRQQAAQQLASALKGYKSQKTIVLGLPEGGALLGRAVAGYLDAGFSVLLMQKLNYPFNPNAAFGAESEDGAVYIFQYAKDILSQEVVDGIINKAKKDLKRKALLYRKACPTPEIADRIVILVDDGIITGASMLSAIKSCRRKNVKKVVVAVPAANRGIIYRVRQAADHVVILEESEFLFSTSQIYEDNREFSEQEVLRAIEDKDRYQQEYPLSGWS